MRSLLLKALVPVLAIVAAFVAIPRISTGSPSADAKPGSTATAQADFPRYAEVEYERSVIRVPVMMAGDKKPREIVELTAFMKLERELPVRNTIGYRQFEFTIREWELFGYSEVLGAHLSFAASKEAVQPKSLTLALQKDADFPSLIVYNAIYDIFLDGRKILSQRPGVAMARGVVEIPPRNVTVAFQKPFAVSRTANGFALNHPNGTVDCSLLDMMPEDPTICIGAGTCEDMSTITSEEFEAGLREARGIRERLATLKPKPKESAAGARR